YCWTLFAIKSCNRSDKATSSGDRLGFGCAWSVPRSVLGSVGASVVEVPAAASTFAISQSFRTGDERYSAEAWSAPSTKMIPQDTASKIWRIIRPGGYTIT